MNKIIRIFVNLGLFVAFAVLLPQFSNSQSVSAQTCSGVFQYPLTCRVTETGGCAGATFASVSCSWNGTACVGPQRNYICGYDNNNVCKVLGDGTIQISDCSGGGGGGGGGTCTTSCHWETECRQADNCGGTQGDYCGLDRLGRPKYECTQRVCTTVCPPTPAPATSTPVPTNTPIPTLRPSATVAPTSTFTPTPTGLAQCRSVLAYSSNFTLLTNAQLTQTRAGDQLYYCVSGYTNLGSFDRARFTINGTLNPDTTLLRPGSTTDFCQSYRVPASTYVFNVVAKIHHRTLGWIQ